MSSLTNYGFVLLYSRVHEPMWMSNGMKHMNTQVICGMVWITGVDDTYEYPGYMWYGLDYWCG